MSFTHEMLHSVRNVYWKRRKAKEAKKQKSKKAKMAGLGWPVFASLTLNKLEKKKSFFLFKKVFVSKRKKVFCFHLHLTVRPLWKEKRWKKMKNSIKTEASHPTSEGRNVVKKGRPIKMSTQITFQC